MYYQRAGVALIVDVRCGSVGSWLRAVGCARLRLIVKTFTRYTKNGVDRRLAPFVKPVLVNALRGTVATRLGICKEVWLALIVEDRDLCISFT